MFKLIMVAAAMVMPMAASAQVFKCVKGKETVYQSEPCADDQVTEKAWQAQSYTPPSNAELWRIHRTKQATSQRDAQLRRGGYGSGSAAFVESGIGRCEAAKRQRDAKLRSYGEAGRSVEVRRAADREVVAACR